LVIPWTGALATTAAAFHDEHEQRFGYRDDAAAVEVVRASVAAFAANLGFPLPQLDAGSPAPTVSTVQASFEGTRHDTAVYELEALAADQHIAGPAILAGESATLLVPPDAEVRVDRYGNVHIAC
jgi:N-methylhydantoinase A